MAHSADKPKAPWQQAGGRDDDRDWGHQPLPVEVAIEAGLAPAQATQAIQEADEEALVRRLKAGQRGAVKELYRTYAPTLLRRILRLLGGDMARAEDCLQQVFLKAMQGIESYRGDNNLLAWLHRITTHTVMDMFRANRRRSRLLEKMTLFRWGVDAEDGNHAIPERAFLHEERKEWVLRGLDTLRTERKMAILLCDWEGYSIEDAAAELDVPIGTLASRLYRGRQELRAWLKKECKRNGFSAREWFDE